MVFSQKQFRDSLGQRWVDLFGSKNQKNKDFPALGDKAKE